MGQLAAHVNNDESKLLCEELNSMTMQEPASFATAPAEIVINILNYLVAKRDWLCIARSCRRLSKFIVAELDKYTVGDGDYYAVWYACVTNKPIILLRHIAFDAAIVNRHFTKDFRRKGTRRMRCDSEWRTNHAKTSFGKDMTPLAVAIIASSEAIVQLLLANGADPNRPGLTSSLDRRPWRPIHWAVASKHESSVAIIKMLGAHSVNTNLPPKDYTENELLYEPFPIFMLLVLQKPQWNPRDLRRTNCEEFNGDLWQLQDLRFRQLEAILQCGADPNIRFDSVTPVFFFLYHLSIYSPSFYFDRNMALSHEEDAQATMVNEIATLFLDMLRDFGADIFEIGETYHLGSQPVTPLHAACMLKDRHKPIIDWFLRNGVSIDSLDADQGTPLMAYCASVFTDLDQFRKFLSNGPLINNSDISGRTALHHLCANKYLHPQVMEKAVKIMLDRGADPTFISNDGLVPAQELDPVGFIDPSKSHQKDVLVMLRKATKTWKSRARRREARRKKSEDEERLALTRSEAQVDRPDNWPSDRERRASHEKDGRENRKNGHENKKPGQRIAGPVGGRSHNHATPKGSNRGNRRENQRGQKENRGESHQNGGTRHINAENDNGKGKETKDARHNNNETPPQGNDQSTPPQDTFHQRIHGGKYCSAANQRSHGSSRRKRHREINPEVTDKSIKSEEPAKPIPIACQSWFRRRHGDEA
ncbi:hypothetical protein FHL15_007584 [Xylaria flabelliformis]|uniref:F-box domain-containing protein n=1 Tax=Xylaria flabelliformis TaxID=2512241 RepID=A0A553HUE1_9PEZI|nr:hypothetical protein FHL15_007584 [Xylaria flabelliformis]